MPSKRTPRRWEAKRGITPAAVAAFQRWRQASTREEQRDAYNELHDLLRARPWEWPCAENPDARCPYPPGCHAAEQWERKRAANPERIALWIELERLAKAAQAPAQTPRRTRSRRLPHDIST
jgi:hypothetical protein